MSELNLSVISGFSFFAIFFFMVSLWVALCLIASAHEHQFIIYLGVTVFMWKKLRISMYPSAFPIIRTSHYDVSDRK